MKRRAKKKWDVDLGFGINAYVSLGMAGFFALLPVTSGLAPIAGFFGAFDSNAGSSSPAGGAILGVLSAFSIVIAPWLLPALVLRARQPKGAGIETTVDEIVEWDGPWKRTAIRWENAEAARLEWNEPGRSRWRAHVALQVLDKTNPRSVITVWEEEPEEAPIVRRRLETSKRDVQHLDSSVRAHCGYARSFEMERIVDPDRPAQRRRVRSFTRLGYVGACLGPLLALPNPVLGLAISAASSLLLAWRAAPVLIELVRVSAHLGGAEQRDPNELQAWRYRLRAVIAEAFVRVALAILPICGAVAAMLTVPR